MRARIRMAEYDMEFAGTPAVWNEHLRPIFGGPEADERSDGDSCDRNPSDGESSDGDGRRGTDAAPRTKCPAPRPHEATTGKAATDAPRHSGTDEPPDIDEILDDLAEAGGRRAEKDAVLVAVWGHGGSRGDVAFRDVATTLHAHDDFRDVRVKPHLLKHISRSRMLAPGELRETAHLTDKGRRYVEELIS